MYLADHEMSPELQAWLLHVPWDCLGDTSSLDQQQVCEIVFDFADIRLRLVGSGEAVERDRELP